MELPNELNPVVLSSLLILLTAIFLRIFLKRVSIVSNKKLLALQDKSDSLYLNERIKMAIINILSQEIICCSTYLFNRAVRDLNEVQHGLDFIRYKGIIQELQAERILAAHGCFLVLKSAIHNKYFSYQQGSKFQDIRQMISYADAFADFSVYFVPKEYGLFVHGLIKNDEVQDDKIANVIKICREERFLAGMKAPNDVAFVLRFHELSLKVIKNNYFDCAVETAEG